MRRDRSADGYRILVLATDWSDAGRRTLWARHRLVTSPGIFNNTNRTGLWAWQKDLP